MPAGFRLSFLHSLINPKNAFKNREVFVVNEAMNKEPQACSRPREGERAEGITLRQIKVFSEY